MPVKKSTPYIFVFALILLAALALLLVFLSWGNPPLARMPVVAPKSSGAIQAEPVAPLPAPVPDPFPERSALGKLLFHETALSSDNSISCASCHVLELAATDGRPQAVGVGGAIGTRNTPSIFNSSLNVAQFWDGRAATLAEQIDSPLHNPMEMASNWPLVIQRLSADSRYRELFARAYPAGITKDTVTDALVHYQQTLISPDAPFDRYLRGDLNAIDAEAIEGYHRFKTYGCASCHQGINIGGNMFQVFGIMGDYFAERGDRITLDPGRYSVTGKQADRYVFKVPSLRNVALTAPYFHDGSVARLEDAVHIMGRYQLGRRLTEEDIRLIVSFLNTLTGTLSDGNQVIPTP